MNWKVGEAKQRLSELLRRSERRPQRIFRRDRLVAAVISADLWEEFERWMEARRVRSLGDRFDELREICDSEGYELDTGSRRDREAGWITDR